MVNHEEILKEKQGMLDRQSKSGQNIQSFCKAEGIAYHHFFYWQKKLSTKPVAVQKKFIELESTKPPSSSVVSELLSINGARLVFYHLPDVLFLKSLIS